MKVASARLASPVFRLPRYLLLLGAGGLLGLYLDELSRSNLDFTGPQSSSPAHSLALVGLVGPGILAMLWLCSGLVGRRLTGQSLRQALALDLPSYWPGVLIGASLLLSLALGRPVTAYHAAVVLLVSVVASLVLGLKAWLVWPHVASTWRARFSGRRLVLVAILAYVVVAGLLVVLRYDGYQIWGVDLGQWDQAIWNTWRGHPLQFTQYGGFTDSLLTDHVVPIAFLIAPVYLVWPDPRALLLLQVVAVGIGAWLVYLLAARHLASRFAGGCLALAYLVHPTIVGAGLDAGGSFRPDVLAVPLFLGALLALEKSRWTWVVILAVLAMACKEYMAALVIMLGLYVVYRCRRFRLGLGLSALGTLWLVGALAVFLPLMRQGQSSIHFQLNFGHLSAGDGPDGILATLMGQPRVLLDQVFSSSNLVALFFLLLSLAFLPLGGWPLLVVAAPIIGLFMLAGVPNLFDFHLAPAFPFLLVAAVAGIKRVAAWASRRLAISPARLTVSLSVVLLGASLAAALFWSNGPLGWGFWTPGRPYTFWKNHFVVDAHDRRADRFVAMVPDGQPVIASDFLLSHLTHRKSVYHFFDPPPDALSLVDCAVIDLFETYIQPREESVRSLAVSPTGLSPDQSMAKRPAGRALYRQLLTDDRFSLVAQEDGLLFLRRQAAEVEGFHYVVRPVEKTTPAVSVGHDFGNRLRLIGYDFGGDPASLAAGQRHTIVYYWQVLSGFDQPFTFQYGVNPVDDLQQLDTDYVLIDTFVRPGSEPFRVVHLPTYLLIPPAEWQPGQILREEYEFVLPPDLAEGAYEWQVGLYLVPDYFPIQTRPERQVPGTAPFAMPAVEVSAR